MKALEMLSEVLRRAQLTPRERESFEDMLDRMHRYGRCTDKQRAWIEKVYFGQKLDQPEPFVRRRVVIPTWQKDEDTRVQRIVAAPSPRPQAALIKAVDTTVTPVRAPSRQVLVKRQNGKFMATPVSAPKAPPVGYINYPGIKRETPVTSLLHFSEVCPGIGPDSKQYRKVADFFAQGGIVLKVKPAATAQVA